MYQEETNKEPSYWLLDILAIIIIIILIILIFSSYQSIQKRNKCENNVMIENIY